MEFRFEIKRKKNMSAHCFFISFISWYSANDWRRAQIERRGNKSGRQTKRKSPHYTTISCHRAIVCFCRWFWGLWVYRCVEFSFVLSVFSVSHFDGLLIYWYRKRFEGPNKTEFHRGEKFRNAIMSSRIIRSELLWKSCRMIRTNVYTKKVGNLFSRSSWIRKTRKCSSR